MRLSYGAIDTDSPTVIADAIATLTGTVASTVNAAIDLMQAGVGTVAISNLPSATFFPAFYAADPLETTIAELVFDANNSLIENAAADLSALGADVIILDTQSMARAITEDPSGFGLIAPYTDTQLDSDVLDDFDADQVAFWDDVHPSTATHGVLGAYNAHVLTGGEVDALTDRASITNLGGGEDNLVLAYGGDDIVGSNDGSDTVFGGTGNDILRGEDGSDLLSGGSDDDVVVGGQGADVLDGDNGDDLLRGNRGADVLIDGLGSDTVQGGGGADTFVYTQASLIGGADGADSDSFDGGGGTDTLYLVLDSSTAAQAETDLNAVLSQLGITTTGIENVEILETRAALSDLSSESWYIDADVWGLI